jgi:antitoxin VapB
MTHFCGRLRRVYKHHRALRLYPIQKAFGHRFLVDLYLWYILSWEVAMGKTGIAKLFRNGRSQAVRLPQEFRFEGDRVRIRRIDNGVILEPLIPDAAKWFHEMDRFNQEQFMGKRRNQPVTPRREIFK